MTHSIWTLKFPLEKDAERFLINAFRQEFPDSSLPSRIRIWPRGMDAWISFMSATIHSQDDQKQLYFGNARVLHENEKQELLSRMVALLQEHEENKDPAMQQLNAVRNLEEFDEKKQESFFRRLPSRLARSSNGAMHRQLKNLRKRQNLLAAAAKAAKLYCRADYTADSIKQYLDCCTNDNKD